MNDELVLDLPRKLADGDVLRLGAKDAPVFEARFIALEVERPPVEPPDPPPQPPDSPTPAAELAALRQQLAERDTDLARLKQQNLELQAHAADRDAALASAAETGKQTSHELVKLREELDRLRSLNGEKHDALSELRGKYLALNAQLTEHKKHAGNLHDESESRRQRAEKDLAAANAELKLTQRSLEEARSDLEAVRNAHNEVRRDLEAVRNEHNSLLARVDVRSR